MGAETRIAAKMARAGRRAGAADESKARHIRFEDRVIVLPLDSDVIIGPMTDVRTGGRRGDPERERY
jgi:hypothetical protein